MRNLLMSALALATLAAPIAAAADPGELRDDRRAIREERRDLREARQSGNPHEIREERRDLQDARQEFREDRREVREERRERRYRGGAYNYPRGYAYRAWNTGAYLPRAYWSQQYYIGRPLNYGLPGAYRGTRWIRVGPDALLIRVRNGNVLRVVRGLYY